MAKGKKQISPQKKASNAIIKPARTRANKQRRAKKHLLKHPNDKVAQIVAKDGAGPSQTHKKHEPRQIVPFHAMRHPDDPKAADYFRNPHHLNWKKEVRREVAETMADQFQGREESDPWAYDRMYARIFGGLGHLEDYKANKNSMMAYA